MVFAVTAPLELVLLLEMLEENSHSEHTDTLHEGLTLFCRRLLFRTTTHQADSSVSCGSSGVAQERETS